MKNSVLIFFFLCLSCSVILPDKQTGSSSFPPQDPAPLSEGDFSLVVLPDTQGYLAYESKNIMVDDQINWIIENQEEENIIMVLHEGDMINSFSQTGVSESEWSFFSNAISKLDQAGIFYGVVPGNHDYSTGERNLDMMNDYLPSSRFEGMESYGGCYEEGRTENSYHRFSAGGYKWLVLLLEFGPRDEVLEWANSLAVDYSDHLIIMVTHGYLDPEDFRLGPGDGHSPDNGYGLSDVNNGVDMWEKLVSLHVNFRIVLCGHTGSSTDGAGLLVSRGINGNRVYEMLANYQNFRFSESGHIRILRFHIDPDRLDVLTYSPSLDSYKEDSENQFSFIPFEY